MKKKHKVALAVELLGINKKYTLHHQKPTFSEHAMQRFRSKEFVALKNVNLQIYQGEKVGIIGQNGSGKTTLLKIIAGIATPTAGSVTTHGKVISLIDLESGFHPDLNGRENIFLNGLLIGMSKEEITQKYKKITNFADIGEFIHEPLYTYSDGMKLRLGFAIAVHADPDILILDEAITAGDQNFQKKSLKKIEEFFRANKTILIVSHWLDFLKKNTQRIILLDNGTVREDNTAKIVIKKYINLQ